MKKALQAELLTLEMSVRYVEDYLPDGNPEKNETGMKVVTASLCRTPGFKNWVDVVNGISDFEGDLGDPRAVERRLKEYIDYNEQHSGASWSLYSTLLSAFRRFYTAGNFS